MSRRHTDRTIRARLDRMSDRQPNGCLEWLGSTIPNGYGKITIHGRQELVHRVTWVLERGAIPAGMLVLHRCDNPICREITHLFLGSHTTNAADMMQKGRWRGRNVRPSDLVKAAVKNDTRPQHVIAAAYNISQSSVSRIKRG